MEDSRVFLFVFIAMGAFSLIASLSNWEFFFTHRKAKFFVNILGRTGARIFYGLLGVGLCGFGIYKMMYI